MATLSDYKGSVSLIAGLKPASSGYPLMEAHDVQVATGDKRLDTKLTEIDTAIGADPSGNTEGSGIKGRVSALEAQVGTASGSGSDTLNARMTTAEGEIDTLQSDLGTKAAGDDDAFTRIGALETWKADAETTIGVEPDDTANPAVVGSGLCKRVADLEEEVGGSGNENSLNARVDSLENAVGDNTSATSLSGRMTAAETDVTALEGVVGDPSAYTDSDSLSTRMDDAESAIDTLSGNFHVITRFASLNTARHYVYAGLPIYVVDADTDITDITGNKIYKYIGTSIQDSFQNGSFYKYNTGTSTYDALTGDNIPISGVTLEGASTAGTVYLNNIWYYYEDTMWKAGGSIANIAIDDQLKTAGAAADAKAVGDAISELSSDMIDAKIAIDKNEAYMEAVIQSKTITDVNMASFNDALNTYISDFIVQFEASQNGSGIASPSNPREFIGYNNINIIISSINNKNNGNTIQVSLEDTIYTGGVLDIINGTLTVFYKYMQLNSINYGILTDSSNQPSRWSGTIPYDCESFNQTAEIAPILCSHFNPASNNDVYYKRADNIIAEQANTLQIRATDTFNMTAQEFKSYLSGKYILLKLKTPKVIVLPKQLIKTLSGANYIWVEPGYINKLTYKSSEIQSGGGSFNIYGEENQYVGFDSNSDAISITPDNKPLSNSDKLITSKAVYSAIYDKNILKLPNKIDAMVGDDIEIFYKGVCNVVDSNYYEFDVNLNPGISGSKNWKRKLTFNPSSSNVGSHTLSINVLDNFGNIISQGSTDIVVHNVPESPASEKVILCVGDSLSTSGGWCKELRRRLIGSGGSPAGLELSNINFIGSKSLTDGTRYEGYGGWIFTSYYTANKNNDNIWITCNNHDKTENTDQHSIYKDSNNCKWKLETIENGRIKIIRESGSAQLPSSGTLTWVSGGTNNSDIIYSASEQAPGNPFWNEALNKNDFVSYAAKFGVDHIDHCIILLGWNSTGVNETYYKGITRQFINSLLADFPSCKITLVGLQIPTYDGMAGNYGTGWLYFNKLQHVWNLQKWYQELCDEYPNSDYVPLSAQFDTDYNSITTNIDVNLRNTTKIALQTNAVHPAPAGYLQIADAVFRNIIGRL